MNDAEPTSSGAEADPYGHQMPWLHGALDAMLEGIQVVDRDYRYRYLNESAARHGRSSLAALLGRTMMECYPGIEATPMFARLRRVVEQSEAQRLLNEFVYPDGGHRWFELRMEPIPEGALILSIDVTDRVEAEQANARLREQLAQLDRLDAIGRMAAGVAHDFNNALSSIIASVELADGLISRSNEMQGLLAGIRDQVEQANGLTKRLLTFGRGDPTTPGPLSLQEICARAVPLLAKTLGPGVSIETHFSDDTPMIVADRTQIEQVITNLIINARDAMPSGGRLTVRCESVDVDEEYARTHARVKVGRYAMLTFADEGMGMDPETQDRIFEPFFTTKPPGKGTGLGLPTVWGIVQRFRGHIWVYSEPGRGTVFKLYFPLADADALPTTPKAQAPRRLDGTLLVVEDDAVVRRLCERWLDRQGYRVVVAGSVEQARKFLRGSGRPAAMLTDLCLPDASGYVLIDEALATWPDLPVVIMSGRYDAEVDTLRTRGVHLHFLEKPFTGEDLGTAIEALFQ